MDRCVERPLCLIFDLVNYQTSGKRLGSAKDSEGLYKTFHERHSKVLTFYDCTAEEIKANLQSVKKYNNHSCLFVVFLAHGYQNGIYSVDEIPISVNEIQSYLTESQCHPFKGKSKILIFQSCRVTPEYNGSLDLRAIETNFLIAFATQRDTPATRDTMNGSPYIQCLIRAIEEHGETEDILSILTIVRRLMNDSYDEHFQIPDYHSLLLSKLYLKKNEITTVVLPRRSNYDSKSLNLSEAELVSSSLHTYSSCEHPIVASYSSLTSSSSRVPWLRSLSQEGSNDFDIYSIDIVRSENSEQHIYLQMSAENKTLECGVCVIIYNSTSCSQLEIEDLQIAFERLQFIVLTFPNAPKEAIDCLLKSINEITCEAFVMFALYDDPNDCSICISNILQSISESESNLYYNNSKLLYFQSISRNVALMEENGCTENKIVHSATALNSACVYVTSERSTIPKFVQMLHNCVQQDITSVQHILERTLKGEKYEKNEIDFNFMASECEPIEMEMAMLILAIQVRTELGVWIALHKDEINMFLQTSRDSFVANSLYKFCLLAMAPVIPREMVLMSRGYLTEYDQASFIMVLEEMLLSNVASILCKLHERSNRNIQQCVNECKDHIMSSIIDRVIKIIAGPCSIETIRATIQELENTSLKAVGNLRDVLNAPCAEDSMLQDEESSSDSDVSCLSVEPMSCQEVLVQQRYEDFIYIVPMWLRENDIEDDWCELTLVHIN